MDDPESRSRADGAPLDPVLDETRQSWNAATARHNAHKLDQPAFFRAGGSTLFPEELELLGALEGRRVLHLQCNAGQDTLSLARLGATVTGVDFSDVAIGFARELARASGIQARFLQSEINRWLETSAESDYDIAFASYGVLPWHADLERLLHGIARVLVPGGRFVFLEIHPLAWSFDEHFRWKDPYFAPEHAFRDSVGDYVGEAAGALSPSGHVALEPGWRNSIPATSWQHTVADVVNALIAADLRLERLVEYPYVNGCRVHAGLVPIGAKRFSTPAGVPQLPWMLGGKARKQGLGR